MRSAGGLPTTLLALLVAAACAPPPEDRPGATGPPLAERGPLVGAVYADRLAESAGGPVSVERFAAAAATAAERVERRMDRLAVEAGENGGWRPLFERLRRQAPPDEASVLAAYREELVRAAAHVEQRRLFGSLPPPPEVVPLENPSLRAHFPLALYHDGRFAVTLAPPAGADPAYLANHCTVCIPPLAVHEGTPGHHLSFSRMRDAAGELPPVAELARHKPYVEGWALYAEVLMLEQEYYGSLERRLAAWRMLLLRLVRAELDAALNGGGLDPGQAEAIYRDRLLLTPEAAAAEVRGHLAKPTVKASYALGLLQILELRRAVWAANPKLAMSDFHDRLLGPPAPLPRIARERFGIELAPPGEGELPAPFGPGER